MFSLIVCNLLAINAVDAAWLLNAQNDLNIAYEKAKEEKKKIVLLVVVKDGCDWCEMMIHNTLKDPNIQANLADIVTVVVDVNSNKLPKEFQTELTPAMFFIDVKSKKSLLKNIGYMKKGGFLIDIISVSDMVE
jgi:thioredoxin-related protein